MTPPNIHLFLAGFLSQWHPARFVIDGVEYGCAEQWMMHRKALLFSDPAMAARIMAADQPFDQKRLGQAIASFDQAVWDQHKQSIVLAGNTAKFSHNAGLRKKLLATGSSILAEANPKDFIWGIGLAATDPNALNQAQWPGQNLLGQILMQVRSALQAGGGDT